MVNTLKISFHFEAVLAGGELLETGVGLEDFDEMVYIAGERELIYIIHY